MESIYTLPDFMHSARLSGVHSRSNFYEANAGDLASSTCRFAEMLHQMTWPYSADVLWCHVNLSTCMQCWLMSMLLDITFNMPFDVHYLLTIYLWLLLTMLDALLCSANSTICLGLCAVRPRYELCQLQSLRAISSSVIQVQADNLSICRPERSTNTSEYLMTSDMTYASWLKWH